MKGSVYLGNNYTVCLSGSSKSTQTEIFTKSSNDDLTWKDYYERNYFFLFNLVWHLAKKWQLTFYFLSFLSLALEIKSLRIVESILVWEIHIKISFWLLFFFDRFHSIFIIFSSTVPYETLSPKILSEVH